MNVLSRLVEEISVAVNAAAAQAHEKNKEAFLSFFDKVESATRTNDVEDVAETRYVPKVVKLDFPVVEDGEPGVRSVGVPLISLADHAAMHLEEFKLNMTLELRHDDHGELTAVSAVSPRETPGPHGDPEVEPTFAKIEMVLKRGEKSKTLVEVVKGYDKAVRAQVPG